MPKPPYTGPETTKSLAILKELMPGLPEPLVLIGGWGVYFTVNRLWKAATGSNYFGSRDIDLGFYTPRSASAQSLKRGNLPATLDFLEKRGFAREGSYSLVRYFAWADGRPLEPEETRHLPAYEYYSICVDLIVSHDRRDLRRVARFRPFSEPLLVPIFDDRRLRVARRIQKKTAWIPAPPLLVAMKLKSLPNRTKDEKAAKDLCDLYALVAYSGFEPQSLGSEAAQLDHSVSKLIRQASRSKYLRDAADHLEVPPETITAALRSLLSRERR